MSLTSNTKDLLQHALGTPEAKNEVVDTLNKALKSDGSVPLTANLDLNGHKAINSAAPTSPNDVATKAYVDASPAGTGDIKSDGTVPFAANQSMGSHKLTNVTDPTSAQDASTKAYVDTLSLLGAAVSIHVNSENGDDSTATGAITKPFQTLEAAQASFSDQSATKTYKLVLAPGDYAEAPTYVPKLFVYIVGAGIDLTSIRHNDDSPIDMPYSLNDGEFFEQIFQDFSISVDFSITRIAVGPDVPVADQSAANFTFRNVVMYGSLSLTGSGRLTNDLDNGPFQFDVASFEGCSLGNPSFFNAMGVTLSNTGGGTINVSDQGVDNYLPDGGGYVNNWTKGFFGQLRFTGNSAAQPRTTKLNRIRLSGTTPTYSGDVNSWGFQSIQLNQTNQITKCIFSQSGSAYDVVGPALAIQLYDAPADGYYFWFNVTDGANTQTDPALDGTGIQVDILTADTSDIIATAFETAINNSGIFDNAAPQGNVFPNYVYPRAGSQGAATDSSDVGGAAAVTTIRAGARATEGQISKQTLINRLAYPYNVITDPSYDLNIFTDYTLYADNPTGVTFNLPEMHDNYSAGIPFIFIDKSGTASTSPSTIVAGAGATFSDGSSSITLNENLGFRSITYKEGVWSITSSSDNRIQTFTSSAGAGGSATEVMTLTGILATDTILSVSQKTPGTLSQPLIGYSTLADNALTGIWPIDPGAGSVIVVSVKR